MFDIYKSRMNVRGSYDGEMRRKNSQKIMDASWMRDAATKPIYVKWVDSGLPVVDDYDTPVYAKFNVKSYHNITGDEVAYSLQFRLEDLKNRSDIKVGSYVQIENELGEPEWWLIVHLDDRMQFRQFSILKCTWVYKWVGYKDGKRSIYQCLGVPRSQNSYNSGEWLDYTFQIVENQSIAIMPTNSDTHTIGYETRMIISSEGRYPPIVWDVSKIHPAINGAITRFTMTQEQFDPSRDDAELMIADYWERTITPELPKIEETVVVNNLELVYSGTPTVRAGGGYKKFALKRYDGDQLIDVDGTITWSINFASGDIDKLHTTITEENAYKVKCDDDYSLVGKTFEIIAESEYGSKSITVEVISL